MTYPDQAPYALASGFNMADSLQVIQGYQPVGVRAPFQGFSGFGFYNPGARRVLPLTDYVSGYPSVQWQFSYMDYDQFLWLQSAYCNDGYTGMVTAAVTTTDQLTIEYWNSKLSLPSNVDIRTFRPGYDTLSITLFKYSDAAPPTP